MADMQYCRYVCKLVILKADSVHMAVSNTSGTPFKSRIPCSYSDHVQQCEIVWIHCLPFVSH